MEKAFDYKPAIAAIKTRKSAIKDECNAKAEGIISIAQSRTHDWLSEICETAVQAQALEAENDNLSRAIITLQNQARPQKPPGDSFQVSSLFLRDCWQELISDRRRREKLHLVTGTITKDGIKVLSRIEKLDFSKQSACYVSADLSQTMHRITSMHEKYGHLVLGMFHNHIVKGHDGTMPSGTDINFMERYAKIGIHCLGGIFSTDGYVRFFNSGSRPFTIQVYGKGWDLIQETKEYRVFKIREGF